MGRLVCKQKTAYERRSSDWSSDVCPSDLHGVVTFRDLDDVDAMLAAAERGGPNGEQGRAVVIGGGLLGLEAAHGLSLRGSEERRVGNECVRTCRSRWAPYN